MRQITTAALAFLVTYALTSAAQAEALSKIVRADQFVEMINGKTLTRTGIKLQVSPDGAIQGRAFGRNVRGEWAWKDGYFCRDLYWGKRELGYNCQEVAMNGAALRFTSDRGRGPHADLWLR